MAIFYVYVLLLHRLLPQLIDPLCPKSRCTDRLHGRHARGTREHGRCECRIPNLLALNLQLSTLSHQFIFGVCLSWEYT